MVATFAHSLVARGRPQHKISFIGRHHGDIKRIGSGDSKEVMVL
jgi:hypothetical protein